MSLRLDPHSVSSLRVRDLLLVIGKCFSGGLHPGGVFGCGLSQLGRLGHGRFGKLIGLGVRPL